LRVIHWSSAEEALRVSREALKVADHRPAASKREKGFVVWMTGLPGSGKTTLAVILEEILERDFDRYVVEVLDGDEFRKGISRDLGLSKEDREEHARRVSFVAKLLAKNGVIGVVALISPYRKSREDAREVVGRDRFVEVYVKASLETCERRDPKGLYKKARSGEITNMTGIQDPYEEPLSPDITVETEAASAPDTAREIVNKLIALGFLTQERNTA
jgi:adenylylsulfate kinase